jgi:uncharacterized protein (DUF1330 family)
VATVGAASGVLAAFGAEVPDGVPIVLVNLLRFRERTTVDGVELSGREAYQRYARALVPSIRAVGGRVVWYGRARLVLIGPPAERWDEVILVAYPRRSAFERMLDTPAYRASAGLRTAVLEDSRLIAVTAPRRVGRVGWLLYTLAARLRRPRRQYPGAGRRRRRHHYLGDGTGPTAGFSAIEAMQPRSPRRMV